MGEPRIADTEGAPFSYDQIADAYAAHVDSAPYNALYERPAMLGLLPDVTGLDVVDAGCGPGWYTEQLLERGARVTALDESSAIVTIARDRVASFGADRVNVIHADLRITLPLPSGRYDGVLSSLVLHYLRDWDVALRELRRILKPGGWLLFSVHHPADEAEYLNTKKYLEVEQVEDFWKWAGRVRYYRRPLSSIMNPVISAGFRIDRVVEPVPTPAFEDVRPKSFERTKSRPAFLLILASAG